ncbi:RNA-binding protein [Tritrichomonas foetus]|uniref:RNA-binding protein n=1 Tax=Tritrichomonas foetus TaxID=1144522 RepID=A0A1J4JTN3_9EUKA|nr:RNA-binding protein [Tritrichomonas foetus]|eukprot:OHT01792.1 RNA-binding protein [Tritrichomonas foetus]
MTQSSQTIFIANLPYSVDGKALADAFEKFGEIVQSRVISTFYRGKKVSRGFGFIDFKTAEGYNGAINNKEDITLQGNNGVPRKVNVLPARPPVPHPKDTIFLGNLEESTTEEDIRAAFSAYKVTEVRLPQARNPNQTKKYFAFVKFETEEIRVQVSETKTVTIKGKEITIRIARPPRQNFRGYRGRNGRGRGRFGRGRGRGGFRGRGRRGGRRAIRENKPQGQAPAPQGQ